MICYFSILNKRINSTKRPQGGTAFDITLKDDTSLLQPEICLKWPGSGSPTEYNYCYIPDFSRYYWISNWTYTERQWAASLTVDVLSSWKTEIGASSKYVLRSAAAYDPHVLDTMYPATGEASWTNASILMSEFGMSLNPGCYVLGVSGKSGSGSVGGNIYYICTQAQITNILSKAFSDIETAASALSAASNIEDVMRIIGEIEYKGTSNVSQFINSLMWIPFSIATIAPGAAEAVYLGYLNAGNGIRPSASIFSQSNSIDYSGLTFGEPLWPDIEPYSHYELYWPPVGSIPLDGVSLASSVSKRLVLTMHFDIISGIVRMVYQYTGLTPAGEASAMLGVPIAIHGQWFDYASMMSALTGVIGSAAALAAGIPDLGAFSSVGNAISAFSPQAVGSGRSGGRGGISDVAYILKRKLSHVPEDITEQGRPLCEIRTLSTLPGFILCRDGDITAPATDGELQQISQYLTGGFYYE